MYYYATANPNKCSCIYVARRESSDDDGETQTLIQTQTQIVVVVVVWQRKGSWGNFERADLFNDVNDGKCDMAVVVVRPKGVGGTEGGRG